MNQEIPADLKQTGDGVLKSLAGFLRATAAGGLLFLMPLVVLGFVLKKAVALAAATIGPLVDRIPDSLGLGAAKANVVAILLLILICFGAGLLARSAIARRSIGRIEDRFLSYLPGYDYLKREGASVLGASDLNAQSVVIARIGDSWRIGVQTETIGESWLAVFIPNSPNPHAGSLFIVERAKVRSCATPLATALFGLRRCGAGMGWAAETLELWEANTLPR